MHVSDNPTDTPTGAGLDRRELLKKASIAGAGVVAAGALAGGASAAPKKLSATPIKRGGRLIFALEQDPVFVAPFGQILTSGHWGKEFAYDSLVEWDKDLNLKPALAKSWDIKSPREIIWNLKEGLKFHNGKELTAADAKYSFDLQAKPPLPGSVTTVSQLPAIETTEVVSKYQLRMKLLRPDARVFGYLAWGRYSPIVPEGLYDQINVSRNAIGTGPFRMIGFNPNDRVEYEANKSFWKPGQPYLDAITLKTLVDEQARVAALRAGEIHGATVSSDSAKILANDPNLTVLKGLTAAFRELQFTMKPGDKKPWHDVRVRQAINFAINRQEILDKVYNGNGEYSGHVPPGYGPWPLSKDDLRNKYLKHDLKKAQQLMKDAGYANGFEVTMTTFSTPLDFQQIAAVMKEQLKAIKVDLNIQAQEPGTFAANNGRGNFDWDLTARGMRGDVDGYLAEFNPSASIYNIWYPLYKNVKVWRAIGNGRITLDQAKRLPLYKLAQQQLMNDLPQVPLIAVTKYQVVNKKVQNHYVAFSDFNTGLRTAWLSS